MHSEIYVESSLIGNDIDPDAIAQLIRIDSGASFVAGDAIAGTSRAKRKETGWELKSSIPRSRPFEEHLREVLSLLSPKKSVIRNLIEQLGLEATICGVVYCYDGDRPSLALEHTDIELIGELGAGFWIDLYNL